MTSPDDRAAAVDWLVGEVSDDLDVGRVGLYEFIWTLRTKYPDASLPVMRSVAQAALAQLTTNDEVRVVRLTWPDATPLGAVSAGDVRDADWDDITEGSYLGVVRAAR